MGRLLDIARQFDTVKITLPILPVDRVKTPPEDLLAGLLDTPLRKLTRPRGVASRILGETVWLVENDRQATAIQAKGGTAYTPEEVAILRDLYAAVKPEVWAERLKLIHQAKKEFQGRLEP
ncbi:MAG: hypothetical protein HY713_13410 [candidate division NC10 bacterium]|nr:hypothetical protein [candidate division NC10 bacterium]